MSLVPGRRCTLASLSRKFPVGDKRAACGRVQREPRGRSRQTLVLAGPGRTADSSVPQLLGHRVGVIIMPAPWGCVRSKSQCVPSA